MSLRVTLRRLRSALEQLEKHPAWLVGLSTAVYLGIVCVLASEKRFWNDELFTFYISRRPSLGDVWNALLTGADQLPPLFFVITRASTAVFGSGGLAFRLPEIFGFWLMGVSLFCFVRRRSSAAYGLVAMLFPMVTSAFNYAFEARPYGLVLGFCGLALLCWQAAAEGRPRVLSLAGLGLSLAGALSCHYYAALAFGPLIAGEAVRSVSRRRLDLGVWIAFGIGLVPLAIFLPLIKAAMGYSHHFWAKPAWMSTVGFYEHLLAPAVFPLFAMAILPGISALVSPARFRRTVEPANSIPIHEIAAVAAFALLPVAAVIVAKTITGAFTDRYVLPAVIGVSVLLAWTLSHRVDHRPRLGLAIAALILGVFVSTGLRRSQSGLTWSVLQNQAATYQFLESQSAGKIPVVIAAPDLFFELSHYAAGTRATKLTYLADIPLALEYTGTDTVERGLLELKNWAPLDVEDFHRFCSVQHEFFIYGYPGSYAWLVPELTRQGRRLVVKASNGDQLLFFVTPESPQDDERF
jgi:hypothetical protein